MELIFRIFFVRNFYLFFLASSFPRNNLQLSEEQFRNNFRKNVHLNYCDKQKVSDLFLGEKVSQKMRTYATQSTFSTLFEEMKLANVGDA